MFWRNIANSGKPVTKRFAQFWRELQMAHGKKFSFTGALAVLNRGAAKQQINVFSKLRTKPKKNLKARRPKIRKIA